jgi:hypothetical protein
MIGLDRRVMAGDGRRAIAFLHRNEGGPIMNTFPILAAFTICASIAILSATFNDLREKPIMLDAAIRTEAARKLVPVALRSGPSTPRPNTILVANEGLLDHEVASADPIQAWLDRYLLPPQN